MANVTLTVSQQAPSSEAQLGGDDICTNATPSTTVCETATATFITDGVNVGDIIKNTTTVNEAIIVSVDSETQVTTEIITGSYTAGDTIQAWLGPVTTPNTGGWPISTTSLKIMAYYKGDTTLIDNYGVDRTTVANWNNITTAEDDAIVVPVFFDTTRVFTFVIIKQNLSSYNEAISGDIIDSGEITVTQLTATTYSININDDTTSESITIGEDPNIVEYSAPAYVDTEKRQPVTRAYDGSGVSVSYLDDRITETATITGNNTVSDDNLTMTTIQRWMRDRVYIMVESDATSYFNWLKGFIQNYSQYTSRITTQNFNILIQVDEEDVG